MSDTPQNDIPASTRKLWLPPEPDSVAEARRATREVTQDTPQETQDAVELVVSELVTNAVKHAGMEPTDRIELSASRSPGRVRVEVGDCGPGFDAPPGHTPGLEEPSGWGLYLVDRLADRWGVQRDAGTRVWTEFDL